MKLKTSDNTYDIISAFVKYILPAVGTLYFALSEIWGFMYADQILGTTVAIETFLGAILFLAKRGWKEEQEEILNESDGEVFIDLNDDGLMTMSLNQEIEEIQEKDKLTFKVVRTSQE